jgi:methionyl-tRNA synthetase
MLEGAGYALPSTIIASGMVKIDEKTFSKSRGYVVWVDEYLDGGFHPDLLRYYLASYTSHTKELNFSWKVFQEKCNNELLAILGNLAYRTLLFAFKNFGEIPDGKIEEEVTSKIKETIGVVKASIDEYEPKRLVDSVMALANFGNSYFQSRKPWELVKDDKEACGEVIKNAIQIVKALAILFEPVMPSKMETLWEHLGMKGDIHEIAITEALKVIESGSALAKPMMLFDRVEDETIARMQDILQERIEGCEERVEKSDLIAYDLFEKLDIRAGRVIEAEAVKGSKKLIRIVVDLGEDEPRQILAGIAKHYTPDELLEKEIIVLTNLEPAKIFGIESRGMLLAAGDGVLLVPDREVKIGDKIG